MTPAWHRRFDGRVRSTTGGCIEWQLSRNRAGYGQMGSKGSAARLAHRRSWELEHGPIPAGQHVLHRCDNPPCVNPAHLFLGTNADNMRDMVAKGRSPKGPLHGSRTHPDSRTKGTRNAQAKLTEAAVREMRRRHAAGERTRDLAAEFGVHSVTALMAISRKSWRHVE